MLVMCMRSNDGLRVLVSEIPAAVVFWIVPPLFAVPAPTTVRPPLEPVLFRTIPLDGPTPALPAEMLLNSSLLAPIVVLATLSAIPLLVVSVLTLAPVAAG